MSHHDLLPKLSATNKACSRTFRAAASPRFCYFAPCIVQSLGHSAITFSRDAVRRHIILPRTIYKALRLCGTIQQLTPFYLFLFDATLMLDHGPSIRPPPFGGMASYQVEAMSPVANEFHPVIHAGAVAVITGAASGIGFAAAKELAKCVLTSDQ